MRLSAVAAFVVASLLSCAAPGPGRMAPSIGSSEQAPASTPLASRAPDPDTVLGLSRLAYADRSGFHVQTSGGDIGFLAGVNVGPTVPGRQPGELAIPADTWRRWLPMIAATGVVAIRVYTLQPPSFYAELARFNQAHPDRPLYLVHGIWIPEDRFATTHDLSDAALLEELGHDIDDAVDALHGSAELPIRPGHAAGTYTSDVSPWLVAWAFGVEMDPVATAGSEALNPAGTYQGRFVSARENATSTEAWMAQALDRIATREHAYGRTMPLTFTNWPTTDPLHHPNEPSANEDLVGIDANHLVASPDWPGGLFASYHAYPYFPDFQRYEPAITGFEYHGQHDPYAGYLAQLRDHHAKAGLPTMILEFGVPSSLGSAHSGPLGRDQGSHDERTAMAIDAQLLAIQADLGLAGGFVFEWTDEWFKRTWNTVDRQIPADRRQLWHDPLTNEQHFGLLATDPGTEGPPIIVDGRDDEWTATNSQVIAETAGVVRAVSVSHDEAYLYMRLRLDESRWQNGAVTVGFDAVAGGQVALPGARPSGGAGADTAIVVGPGRTASAFVRADNDPNSAYVGPSAGQAAATSAAGWNPQRLLKSRALHVPGLDIDQPLEWHELNPLPTGTTDPEDPAYNSLTVWAASNEVIELRVPWALVGLADPSSRQALVVSNDGTLSTTTTDRLGVTIAIGSGVIETSGYRWTDWTSVRWRERPKAGLEVLAAELDRVTTR